MALVLTLHSTTIGRCQSYRGVARIRLLNRPRQKGAPEIIGTGYHVLSRIATTIITVLLIHYSFYEARVRENRNMACTHAIRDAPWGPPVCSKTNIQQFLCPRAGYPITRACAFLSPRRCEARSNLTEYVNLCNGRCAQQGNGATT